MTEQEEGATPARRQAINEIEELYGIGPQPTAQRLVLELIKKQGYAALTDAALQRLLELQRAAWREETSWTNRQSSLWPNASG